MILLVLFAGCGENDKAEKPATPRIRKLTKLVTPKQNQQFSMGDQVSVEINPGDQSVDSIIVELSGSREVFTDPVFTLDATSSRVGSTRIRTTVYFGEQKESHQAKVVFLPNNPPEEYTYEIVNTFPHDPNDYTQGLLIHDGFMYESTGQNGSSTFEKKHIESGETVTQINLSDDYFGEGLAILNDQFYQITYTAGACFVYDQNLERINTFSYQGQGWGLTEYEGKLLMTNSSEKIAIRDPNSFSVIEEFEVYDTNGKVDYLNELEIIDGMIYANIYQKDLIVVIDPETGAVVRNIDMSGLLNSAEARRADVLNGIAYDNANGRIFVTGKLWPKLFEVNFIPKKPVQ